MSASTGYYRPTRLQKRARLDPNERRDLPGGWTTLYSVVGRTRMETTCPFCGALVLGMLWSIAGCGKACPCGALLTQWSAWRRRSLENVSVVRFPK